MLTLSRELTPESSEEANAMDEQPFCTDPELGEVLRQYLQRDSVDIPGERIKDALFHAPHCTACNKEFPDAKPWGHAWWRAIISGRVPVAPGEVLNAEYHWTSCDRCKQEYPNGLSALASLRTALQLGAKSEILKLYHEYVSAKHRLLAGMTQSTWEEENEAIARTLACLASNGGLVSWELAFFHDTEGGEGISCFKVFPDKDDSEAMEAWRGTNPLLRSVPKEVQQFVFEATLCTELLQEHLDEEEFFAKINNELRYSINCKVLLRAVEAAAVQCLGEYLQENPERAAPPPLRPAEAISGVGATPDLRRIESKLSELKGDLQDQIASVQAVQMGHQRELERISRKPSDYEPVLRDKLGATYALLHPSTREFLQEGEWRHEQPQGPPGCGSATFSLALAFENEFKIRIAGPVARELAQRFGPTYPPDKPGTATKGEAPFVVGGGPNPILTLGNYSWYARNDPNVAEIVSGLGFNLHELKQALSRLTPLRNRAGHPQSAVLTKGGGEVRHPVSPKDADDVRKMILGPQSILNLLFLSAGSKSI